MLRIYDVVLETVREAAVVAEALDRRDRDLARQMRRALTNVPLNVSEGSCAQGRNRAQRHATAAGSMREVVACIQTAEAMRLIGPVDPRLLEDMRLVVGTLMKNVRGAARR
jgi:four helix bundle protein